MNRRDIIKTIALTPLGVAIPGPSEDKVEPPAFRIRDLLGMCRRREGLVSVTPNPYRAHWRLRMVASDEAVERVEEGMLEAFLLSELPLEEARPSIARHHLVSVNCHNDISSLDPPGSSRLTWFVDGPPVWSFGFQVEGVSQLLVVATGSLRGNYHRDEVNQNAHWLAKIREGVDVMESIKSYFGVA